MKAAATEAAQSAQVRGSKAAESTAERIAELLAHAELAERRAEAAEARADIQEARESRVLWWTIVSTVAAAIAAVVAAIAIIVTVLVA